MKKFEIYENSFSLGWNVVNLRGSKAKRVYHTPSRGDANTISNLLNETGDLELIPSTKHKFIPVLFKVNDYYYLISSEIEANEAMLLHLTKQVKHLNITRFGLPKISISQEEVDHISNEDVRADAQQRLDIQKSNYDYYDKHNKIFNKLSERIKNGKYEGIFSIFDYFEKHNYQFEHFNNLSY